MMGTVESSEANQHLPSLLEPVVQGEEITITARGKTIARLIPVVPPKARPDLEAVLAKLKAFSKGNTLGDDLTLRDLIEEGRQF